MIVKLQWLPVGGAHIRVTVFTGPDADHLANAGELTFRYEEAQCFHDSVRQGTGIEGAPGFSGILESGWWAATEQMRTLIGGLE